MPIPDEVIALEFGLVVLSERHNDSVASLRDALNSGDFLYSRENVIAFGKAGARAALSALEAAGWVCVPKEPTDAMRSAAWKVSSSIVRDRVGWWGHNLRVWRAMLAATQGKG